MSNTAKTLKQRVAEVFSTPANEQYVDDYQTTLRQKLERINENLSRSVTRALLLMALFELLLRGAIEKATIGPVELKDLGIIRTAIPALVAYYFYQMAILAYEGGVTNRVYSEIFKLRRKDWYDNDFHTMAVDWTLGPLGPSAEVYQYIGTPSSVKLANRLSNFLSTALPVSLIIFIIYASIIQFLKFGLGDIALWIATVLALAFLVYGLVIFSLDPGN